MDDRESNNPRLAIGPGITEKELRVAVEQSGYPLQTFVGGLLRVASFQVEEEWAYVDRDSGDLRAMDLRARMPLAEHTSSLRARPCLDLLVECKQSELPYVFFESNADAPAVDHLKIYGLRHNEIEIFSGLGREQWSCSIFLALGLHDHEFQKAPKVSKTFSKCVRKGKGIELSGKDAYSNLVLPLVKALDHLRSAEEPNKTFEYFDANLSLAVGVLDAPMVTVHWDPSGTVLESVPWVRVLRHEYASSNDKFRRDRYWAVDIVHKDYLNTYLGKSLMPFAEAFGKGVERHHREVASGHAIAAEMDTKGFVDIESRLRPR
jgi:hypothetical protein